MADLKQTWRSIRPKVVGDLVYGIVRLVCATVRVKAIDFPEHEEGAIFCGWHGKSMIFSYYFRHRSWWVIISQSNDGEMQTKIFRKMGYQVIRGSTKRGGVRAAVEAIRALKEGGTLAMTPDGPRGPSGVVQGGVMLMAQKSGARLIPVGISARPSWRANSWDKYMFALPFAKGVMIFGDPLTVPKDADEEEVERVRLQLEQEITRLEGVAERMLGF